MYKKQVWTMKVIVGCGLGIAITLVIGIFVGEIKVYRISNRLSIQDAEVETNKPDMRMQTVRQSLGIFEVTAYCPNECCCGDYADGITANGHRIQFGDIFCAADPIIPFGKYLDIPGYGYVPVWDRGKDIRGAKLDVFFPTHKEALEWGVRELEIFCWVEGE